MNSLAASGFHVTRPFYWACLFFGDLRRIVFGNTDDVVAEMDGHGAASVPTRRIYRIVVVMMLRANTVASAHFYYYGQL